LPEAFNGLRFDDVDFTNNMNNGAKVILTRAVVEQRFFLPIELKLSSQNLSLGSLTEYKFNIISASGSLRFDDNIILEARGQMIGFHIKKKSLLDMLVGRNNVNIFIDYQLQKSDGSKSLTSTVRNIQFQVE